LNLKYIYFLPVLHKPGLLTKFGWADYHNSISPDINGLTPAMNGQFIPAKCGQDIKIL